MTSTTETWHTANQHHLVQALAQVRAALECHIARLKGETATKQPDVVKETPQTRTTPPALETLCTIFRLSPFERDLLVLCAGVELDFSIAGLCGAAQGDSQRAFPTFSLALAALPEAHWSAITPSGPLRRWRLIEVLPGMILTSCPLRIDERVLHYLAGVPHLDERLAGIVTPMPAPQDLVPSHTILAQQIVAAWSQPAAVGGLPVVQLCGGDDPTSKHAVAATACAALGLRLGLARAEVLPTIAAEVEAFIRLWEREAALSGSALLLDCESIDTSDAIRTGVVIQLAERLGSALLITTRERRPLPSRATIGFDIVRPRAAEQRDLWHAALGKRAGQLTNQIEQLIAQFELSAPAIRAASAEAINRLEQPVSDPEMLDIQVWDACRALARPKLDNLAVRIKSAATWEELVLPEAQRQTLREVVMHVRQRAKVYEDWGFAARGTRGLGISALFAGSSGTGKTMAAEVLAHELRLDLYRIDLSAVVSKYIGETEKNLRQIFDAAEIGGAILLFDEADALFGKRSEVKDSHDRYANIEVSYLLQRMESYRGLAILTTNLKQTLDTAFLRRIRFFVPFPFPDATQRADIWRRIFPASVPTAELDIKKLARLNVAGGNIRNIALNAAFLAADEDSPVGMHHLLHSARTEYTKLEKTLTEAEIAEWV